MGKAKSNFYNNRYYDESVELNCGDNHWNIPQASVQNEPFRSKLQSEIISKIETEKKNIDVKLPLKEWMTLLDEQNTKKSIQYSIEKATYKAVAEFYNIEFTCTFDILVFGVKQRIPLLPSSLALKNSSFKYSENLHQEAHQEDHDSCVGLHLDAHSFYPERPGRYTVTLDILANYLTTKKNGVGLSIPTATYNTIDLIVFKKVQISISEPLLRSKPGDTKLFTQNNTIVSQRLASFPPTSYIKLQWIDFDDDEEGESSNNSPTNLIVGNQNNNNNNNNNATVGGGGGTGANVVEKTKATVQQYTLASVDEGVIVITNSFKYDVVSGSLSSFEIIVGSNVRILSVEGINIKKWDCNPILPLVNISDGGSVSSQSQYSEQLIKVQLNSPVEQGYILRVMSEIEMDSTSGTVQLTSMRAKGSEISREKGFLVVEAITTVEVEQIAKDSLTLIDKSELPNTLVGYTSGPLLLSYKFLDPRYKLEFKVTKHDDLSVLVAICDSASYIATLSSEGSLLYKLIFRIKNTQQQYIRISIPHEFNIWTTVLDGSSVKPGIDQDAKGNNSKIVMIPLKKSSGAEKGIQRPFTVEIVYKHADGVDIRNQGELNLLFPEIDIPISTLFINLYLPSEYKYSKFTGNVKQVSYFSQSPPASVTSPSSNMRQQQQQIQQQQVQQQVMPQAMTRRPGARNMQIQTQMFDEQETLQNNALYRSDSSDDLHDDEDEDDNIPILSSRDQGTVGLKPVMVSIPTVGTQIFLQQLLLLKVPVKVTTTYKLKKKCC